MAKQPKPYAIPDSQILGFIESGLLWILNPDSPNPAVIFRYVRRTAILRKQGGRQQVYGGDRYSVELHWGGKRRTITRSKLVYMAVKHRCIPVGFCVHHVDEDRHNDAISNLRCFGDDYHSQLHGFGGGYDY